MADLKPRPFCGGKAAFVPRAVNIVLQKDPSDPKFGVSVICGRCSAETANMVDEAHAAAKWNARTDGAAVPLTNERIEQLAKEAGFGFFGQWMLWQGDTCNLQRFARAVAADVSGVTASDGGQQP